MKKKEKKRAIYTGMVVSYLTGSFLIVTSNNWEMYLGYVLVQLAFGAFIFAEKYK